MATGSSYTYKSQVKQLPTDLSYWEEYIQQVSGVVQTFSSTITELQDQISDLTTKLEGLTENVSTFINDTDTDISILYADVSKLFSYHTTDKPTPKAAATSYVKLSTSGLEIEASSKAGYTKSIGIFSNIRTVYVYANKSYDNVTFDGVTIKDSDETKLPFTSFSTQAIIRGAKLKGIMGGSISKKINTQKGAYAGKVTLYFSDSSTFNDTIYNTATKLDITINRNIKDNFSYLRTGAIPTSISQAIDQGINANNLNKSVLNTNLSATKAISTINSTKPTSITNIAVSNNVKASTSKLTTTKTGYVRASGQSSKVLVTEKNGTATTNRKLR